MSRTWIFTLLAFGVGNPHAYAGGDIPQAAVPELMKRAVSPEGIAYLQKLRKNTPFGTNEFDLKALRAGMGTRRPPTIKDVKLIKVMIGEIPCEWVQAPGARTPVTDRRQVHVSDQRFDQSFEVEEINFAHRR